LKGRGELGLDKLDVVPSNAAFKIIGFVAPKDEAATSIVADVKGLKD
jgi:hypothetical protein